MTRSRKEIYHAVDYDGEDSHYLDVTGWDGGGVQISLEARLGRMAFCLSGPSASRLHAMLTEALHRGGFGPRDARAPGPAAVRATTEDTAPAKEPLCYQCGMPPHVHWYKFHCARCGKAIPSADGHCLACEEGGPDMTDTAKLEDERAAAKARALYVFLVQFHGGDHAAGCHFENECAACSILDCKYNDPLHYHHDGCPSEWTREQVAGRADGA